jgi:hypothetical protein
VNFRGACFEPYGTQFAGIEPKQVTARGDDDRIDAIDRGARLEDQTGTYFGVALLGWPGGRLVAERGARRQLQEFVDTFAVIIALGIRGCWRLELEVRLIERLGFVVYWGRLVDFARRVVLAPRHAVTVVLIHGLSVGQREQITISADVDAARHSSRLGGILVISRFGGIVGIGVELYVIVARFGLFILELRKIVEAERFGIVFETVGILAVERVRGPERQIIGRTGHANDASTRRMPVAPLLSAELVARRLRVRARDVVYVKGVLEASEGVGVLFAEHGGDLVVASPRALESALEEVLADLARELGVVVEADPRGEA